MEKTILFEFILLEEDYCYVDSSVTINIEVILQCEWRGTGIIFSYPRGGKEDYHEFQINYVCQRLPTTLVDKKQ